MFGKLIKVAQKGNLFVFLLIVIFISGLFFLNFENKIEGFQSKKYDSKYINPLHLNKLILLNIEKNKLEDLDIVFKSSKYEPDIEETKGLTPLSSAILNSNLKAVIMLVEKGNVNINFLNKNNFAPIHFAINTGNMDIIKYLVNHKDFDKNITYQGNNLLHFSAYFSKIDELTYLLKLFPELKKEVNNEGFTPKEILNFQINKKDI